LGFSCNQTCQPPSRPIFQDGFWMLFPLPPLAGPHGQEKGPPPFVLIWALVFGFCFYVQVFLSFALRRNAGTSPESGLTFYVFSPGGGCEGLHIPIVIFPTNNPPHFLFGTLWRVPSFFLTCGPSFFPPFKPPKG